MVTVAERIVLLEELGAYMASDAEPWLAAKAAAASANAWFTTDHVDRAVANIVAGMLTRPELENWVAAYPPISMPRHVGIVMAGNIPLVGFHDFLCVFASGHNAVIKPSSKDDVLIRHIAQWLIHREPRLAGTITFPERLTGCDAYIATGSNNTSRYFESYFGAYPNIIRKNRTSVALLDGDETDEELEALSDDVYLFFGLGCRNVTQLLVPKGYNFERLLRIFSSKDRYADLHKYNNNYDYHLAIFLLNAVPYMSNKSLLMVENAIPFSAVSVLHYRHYTDRAATLAELHADDRIQMVVGRGCIPFGRSQQPGLFDYADGVDTMKFLTAL
jgi:hypothetical protein